MKPMESNNNPIDNNLPANRRINKYDKVSDEKKNKLVKLVLVEGMKISSSARLMDMKLSTAGNIISKYKKDGREFSKSKRKHRKKDKITGEVTNFIEEIVGANAGNYARGY